MKIRKPNLLEQTVFEIETELDHLSRLIRLDARDAQLQSVVRINSYIRLLQKGLDQCETMNLTQSERERLVGLPAEMEILE